MGELLSQILELGRVPDFDPLPGKTSHKPDLSLLHVKYQRSQFHIVSLLDGLVANNQRYETIRLNVASLANKNQLNQSVKRESRSM